MVPVLCCTPSRFWRLSCGGVVFTSSALNEFGWRWFPSSENGFLDPGQGVLANAISIDGRKEWTGKFCSESMLPGGAREDRQAVAAKSGEWSTGSSTSSGEEDGKAWSLEAEKKEFRARIDALEEKEGVQGGPRIPSQERGDSEDGWGELMEVEGETESRKKLDEQKKKMQEELRDVDRLSFVSKDMQESIMESLQHQLQDVEKRIHDSHA